MIKGIFTPNLVPFLDDGCINEGELRRMVNWLVEKGVSGLYPNGSTGEFIRLSFEERKRVIQIVVEENRGRVPILAGAAESNLTMILDACRTYADLGCEAIHRLELKDMPLIVINDCYGRDFYREGQAVYRR